MSKALTCMKILDGKKMNAVLNNQFLDEMDCSNYSYCMLL